jgi:CheY-like chemotaxis protein
MGKSLSADDQDGSDRLLPFEHGVAAAAPVAAGAARRMRILLAEDNPINRRLMASLLSGEGHQVVAVEDGSKALGAIAVQSFDIVLMDMQMPLLDGIAATRAIRALGPPASCTPILAISADSMPERRRIYFEAGIDDFLAKPIVAGQLLEMIAKMRRSADRAGQAVRTARVGNGRA